MPKRTLHTSNFPCLRMRLNNPNFISTCHWLKESGFLVWFCRHWSMHQSVSPDCILHVTEKRSLFFAPDGCTSEHLERRVYSVYDGRKDNYCFLCLCYWENADSRGANLGERLWSCIWMSGTKKREAPFLSLTLFSQNNKTTQPFCDVKEFVPAKKSLESRGIIKEQKAFFFLGLWNCSLSVCR